MLSEVNVKATIQCHYSWSCQEKKKRAGGLFIQKKNAFSAEGREWPAHSGLCLHVCGAEWSILLQDTALPPHQKNAVYFRFLVQVVFGRVSVRDS